MEFDRKPPVGAIFNSPAQGPCIDTDIPGGCEMRGSSFLGP